MTPAQRSVPLPLSKHHARSIRVELSLQHSRAALNVRFLVYSPPAYSVALNRQLNVTGRVFARVSIQERKRRAAGPYPTCLLNACSLCFCERQWLGLHVYRTVDEDISDTAVPFEVKSTCLHFSTIYMHGSQFDLPHTHHSERLRGLPRPSLGTFCPAYSGSLVFP